MRIEVDTELLQIEIFNEDGLVCKLDFDMCDEEMLIRNGNELVDLLNSLHVDSSTNF